MKKVSLYFHTLKYLKLKQFGYRLLKKLSHPKVNFFDDIATLAPSVTTWIAQPLGKQKFLSETDCCFLNKPGSVLSQDDWNEPAQEKLWLYNLHYFDDLIAKNASERRAAQSVWLDNWIKHNPAPKGNGWEPYPISLRVVNWVKAFLDGFDPKQAWLNSLATQADYLSQELEYHLLGNHLFVNGKALLFAGCFIEGQEANRWLEKGAEIIGQELDEQVLEDGANFELTPMYHAIMLVDLLDMVNLGRTFPAKFPKILLKRLEDKIPAMLQYLADMSHIDGKISFFNDSALGIAPDNAEIFEYAKSLGFSQPTVSYADLTTIDYPKAGHVVVKSSDVSLIADLSQIGPTYIPGHAHADTFSFELAVEGKRVFVNSGISEYGLSSERLRQRQTSAHNTVAIDGIDSCEVWSGFRVARRGNTIQRTVDINKHQFSASHTGFKQQGINCLHKREWQVSSNKLVIADELIGTYDKAEGYLHLHPDVDISHVDTSEVTLNIGGTELKLATEGAHFRVAETSWHPEFGISVPTKKIVYIFDKPSVVTQITWK